MPFSGPDPQLITRMIGDGLGLKAYEHGHITMIAPGSFDLGYIKGAAMDGAGSQNFGTTIRESPFTSNVAFGTRRVQRKRFTLNFDAEGIYISVHKTGAESMLELMLAAIEIEVRDATYGSMSDAVFP